MPRSACALAREEIVDRAGHGPSLDHELGDDELIGGIEIVKGT